jgi:hypothetical protein
VDPSEFVKPVVAKAEEVIGGAAEDCVKLEKKDWC